MKAVEKIRSLFDSIHDNVIIRPVRYKFQGIPLRRKGFDIGYWSKDHRGELYFSIILEVEPVDYSNNDKWLVHSNLSKNIPTMYAKSLPLVYNKLKMIV